MGPKKAGRGGGRGGEGEESGRARGEIAERRAHGGERRERRKVARWEMGEIGVAIERRAGEPAAKRRCS